MDYHILEQNDLHNRVRVAFHIATPVGMNQASKTYAACIKEHLTPESSVPSLETTNPTEHTAIANGETYEYIITFEFANANASVANKVSQLDMKFTDLNTKIPGIIQTRYEWWGIGRDVV